MINLNLEQIRPSKNLYKFNEKKYVPSDRNVNF
jgi:hypothetical protein